MAMLLCDDIILLGFRYCVYINSLWPSETLWLHRFGSTLDQVLLSWREAIA